MINILVQFVFYHFSGGFRVPDSDTSLGRTEFMIITSASYRVDCINGSQSATRMEKQCNNKSIYEFLLIHRAKINGGFCNILFIIFSPPLTLPFDAIIVTSSNCTFLIFSALCNETRKREDLVGLLLKLSFILNGLCTQFDQVHSKDQSYTNLAMAFKALCLAFSKKKKVSSRFQQYILYSHTYILYIRGCMYVVVQRIFSVIISNSQLMGRSCQPY